MRNNLDASRAHHIYKTENRLKYTCAIFKCFVNAFTNCLHITRLLLSSFVGLWGGINFNFLCSALFFFPLPFAVSVSIFFFASFFCLSWQEGKNRDEYVFVWIRFFLCFVYMHALLPFPFWDRFIEICFPFNWTFRFSDRITTRISSCVIYIQFIQIFHNLR